MPRGPGPVAAVHRLFIASALVCGLVYAAWEAAQFRRTGALLALLRAALAFGASLALAAYLRRLRGLGARLTPREGRGPEA
jgi:hypothetical protein